MKLPRFCQKSFISNLIKDDAFRTIRSWLYLGALLAVLLLTFRNWFFESSILTRGDWPYFTNISLKTFRLMYFHVWLSDKDFGRTLIDIGQAPTYAMYGVLAKWFGLGYPYGERLINMIPAVLLAPAGSYMLLSLFTKRILAIAVGTTVFCCNTYFLQLLTGDITIATAYAIAPLVLYAFIRHFRNPTIKSGVLAALASIFMVSYEPRVFYVVMLPVILYFSCYIPFRKDRKVIFAGLKGTFVTSLPFILIILLCFYWMIGIFMSGSENDAATLSGHLFGSDFFVIQNALTVDQPFWTGGSPQPFVYHSIFLNQWVIPFGAILSLYLNRKRKEIFYAGVLVIVGILLGKQVSEPFSSLYPWLFTNVPGFNAFREASKFYLITAIGGSILLALLVDAWYKTRRHIVLKTTFALAIIALLLFNLKPFITGSIDSTVSARKMPLAYQEWNEFIGSQSDFSRVLWLPMKSRWADDTPIHPDISASTAISGAWNGLYQSNPVFTNNGTQPSSEQKITSVYAMGIARELMKIGSIKYIVVPARDSSGVDDVIGNYGNDRNYYIDVLEQLGFLKKLDLQMDGLVVYENEAYKPYIHSSTSLKAIATMSGIDNVYNFSSNQDVGKGFNFTVGDVNNKLPATGVQDIFGGLSSANFNNGTIKPNIANLSSGSSDLYANTNRPELSYQESKQKFTVYEANHNKLFVNKQPIGNGTPEHVIYSKQLASSKQYYLSEGGSLIDLAQLRNSNINTHNGQVRLFSSNGSNIVPDPSFESSLWQKQVEDCNDYDGHYGIAMGMKDDPTQSTAGHKSLQLTTLDHTACTTSKPIPVSSGAYYRFSFDYKDYQAKYSGYVLTFNDRAGTRISDYTQQNGRWSNYSRLIQAPDGATSGTVRLLGYPEDIPGDFATTNYDNVVLTPLSIESNININTNPVYTKISVNPNTTIAYKDSGYSYKNLVPNPSFESGLWQKKVGDCNNYDDNPEIGMGLDTSTASAGHKSLALNAARHIACTNTNPINVIGGSQLYLSFDYQSLDDPDAHYSVTFNDPSNTLYTQPQPISGTMWSSYATTLTVPEGATQATVGVSAVPSDTSNNKVTVRYDNFRLMEIPDVQNSYFLVNNPKQTFVAPRKVDFSIVNPTERLVRISGATTPFFLNMGETYNSRWRLEMNNARVHKLDSWLPEVHPDAVPTNNHYKLDDFANGWYVDVDQLCKQKNLCTRNADGSYNLNMEIEFTSQRWMNAGMIVSGITFIGCIGYLGRYYYKHRRESKGVHYVARR
jgi:hypothetical protein